MSFLRHGQSIVRWEFMAGAEPLGAPLPPSHRLDELQPVIPWRVALLQSPLLLHQPVSSLPQPAATVNRERTRVAGFSTGIMLKFQPELTRVSMGEAW
jgi:hypothetical protein